MKLDQRAADAWMKATLATFPRLPECLAKITGDTLVIGAAVLNFYERQRWIDNARSTGDVDISIGITPSSTEYDDVKQELLKAGYDKVPDQAYTLTRPLTGSRGILKLDLLVHPLGETTPEAARRLMGVGDEWSFDGINFGLARKLKVQDRVFVPNPIGYLGLKAYSYHLDPRRVRDLVDIVDVIKGTTLAGVHYDLEAHWQEMAQIQPQGAFVRNALRQLADPDSVVWDLGRARQEFYNRHYTDDDVDGGINEIVAEFCKVVGI